MGLLHDIVSALIIASILNVGFSDYFNDKDTRTLKDILHGEHLDCILRVSLREVLKLVHLLSVYLFTYLFGRLRSPIVLIQKIL